jgi:polyphosphate kinase
LCIIARPRFAPPRSLIMHPQTEPPSLETPDIFLNRELSWLAFARRVIELACDPELPLLERVKFAGISGMLHDEFFMKRMGGLKRQVRQGINKLSLDGRTPPEELAACREEIRLQMQILERLMNDELCPALRAAGLPILHHHELTPVQQAWIREEVTASVLPILTPLAVDAEHPFPFISSQGLNLAVLVLALESRRERFVRLKVPTNRPRWVPLPGGVGLLPLEQAIAANLDLLLGHQSFRYYLFRVTRGSGGTIEDAEDHLDDDDELHPGGIVRQVTRELKSRRFAGITRLKVSADMPGELRDWLVEQLGISPDDVFPTASFLGLNDLLALRVAGHEDLRVPAHEPAPHPRLRPNGHEPGAIFEEIRRGDLLLHHPYQSFEGSVLRFLEEAAEDPRVLAIKLTIYRTSSDSPIIRALAEAARRGKQVAVLVEITARFDEAPNIAWGQLLEREGVHVAYGIAKLKTHVKLALVVREEDDGLRSYAHVGTGNYHTGTARIYEDFGLLTSDPEICRDVTAIFRQLTGALPLQGYEKLLVAPTMMRVRFTEMIQREAEHARSGRPAGIRAKMNQLQDPEIIRELYRASRAGVPICLQVRGLSCLRPGVPGLSETIRVFSVVGRFLEHGRIYEFTNGGAPEYYLGSADWMRRNLDRRVESVTPVLDPDLRQELARILSVYEEDNHSAWDCAPDGTYRRRRSEADAVRRDAQETFMQMAQGRSREEVAGPAAGEGSPAPRRPAPPARSPTAAARRDPGKVGGGASPLRRD